MGQPAKNLNHYKGAPFIVSIQNGRVLCDPMLQKVDRQYDSAEFDVVLDDKNYALGVFVYDDLFNEVSVTDRKTHSATLRDVRNAGHSTIIRFAIDLVPLSGAPSVRALDPIIVND